MFKQLSNIEIEDKLKLYNIKLNGIIMSNELNKLYNGFYIVNLDRVGGSGTHWTCLYYDGKINYYFDSFGQPPNIHIEKILGPIFIYNKEQIQNIKSDACGYYCIAWIRFMSRGKNKNRLFNIFNNLFNNIETNEKKLKFFL
jgi:hypothetical protein